MKLVIDWPGNPVHLQWGLRALAGFLHRQKTLGKLMPPLGLAAENAPDLTELDDLIDDFERVEESISAQTCKLPAAPPTRAATMPQLPATYRCPDCGAPLGERHLTGCEASKPREKRTFNPIAAAVGNVGTRDEAMLLLERIAPFFARLDDRVGGFVRGMRDKLLSDDSFQPSEKQMDWLRALADNGPPRRNGR